MDPSGGRDSRYNLNYSMSMMSEASEIYGNPNVTLARPPSGLGQVIMGRGGGGGSGGGGGLMNTQNSQCGNNNITSRGIKRTNSDCYDHDRSGGMGVTQNLSVLENCGSSGGNNSVGGVTDVVNVDDSYTTLTQQNKKSPPSNGKKTKGRVKIKMEYIDNKLRRYTTFSKRKTGIMKKAYELSTLTGTQVMLLVASETGHVYTFATRKLQPMITSEAGKALIQTCLNSPDPPTGVNSGDQRMSATGFEETELSYNIADDDSKDSRAGSTSGDSDDSSGPDSPGPNLLNNISSSSSSNMQQNTPMDAHQSSNASSPVMVHSSNQTISSTSGSGGSGGSSLTQHQQQLSHIITSSSGGGSSVHHDLKNSNIVYPSALANLPQDVLISLVQTGRLQLHADEDGSHQYITIPLSMMPGALSTNNKLTIKDTLNINGRESPPNQEIVIKKESNE